MLRNTQTIKLICSFCGIVYIPVKRIRLWVDLDNIDQSMYRFTCSVCDRQTEITTGNKRFMRYLRDSGVKTLRKRSVKKPVRPSVRDPANGPLTPNDLIDMHFALQKIDSVKDLFDILRKRSHKNDDPSP